jgi:hypothetical protein
MANMVCNFSSWCSMIDRLSLDSFGDLFKYLGSVSFSQGGFPSSPLIAINKYYLRTRNMIAFFSASWTTCNGEDLISIVCQY